MTTKFDNLIKHIEDLIVIQDNQGILGEDDGEFFSSSPKLEKPGYEEFTKLIQEIELDLCGLFINSEGSAMLFEMDKFKQVTAGKYFIVCGERDSFGWLTGVLVTPRGKIVYG